jgi:2,3-diketo-5-methylthiopentyl-1-phosphate enolase
MPKTDLESLPIALPDGVDYDEYVIGTYLVSFPFYGIRPTFPTPSGGITPKMVPDVIRDLGPEVVIGSGGGTHAHPQGPVAGAKALRQAVQATMKGRSLEDAAQEHPELKAALDTCVGPFGKRLGM